MQLYIDLAYPVALRIFFGTALVVYESKTKQTAKKNKKILEGE